MSLAAHLLHVTDPSTGRPLEANKLKAEVAAFMAAGRQPVLLQALPLLAAVAAVAAQT